MSGNLPAVGAFAAGCAELGEAARRVELMASYAEGLADRIRAQANTMTSAVSSDWAGPSATAARTRAALEASQVLRCAVNVDEFAQCLRRHGRAAAENAMALQAMFNQMDALTGDPGLSGVPLW